MFKAKKTVISDSSSTGYSIARVLPANLKFRVIVRCSLCLQCIRTVLPANLQFRDSESCDYILRCSPCLLQYTALRTRYVGQKAELFISIVCQQIKITAQEGIELVQYQVDLRGSEEHDAKSMQKACWSHGPAFAFSRVFLISRPFISMTSQFCGRA